MQLHCVPLIKDRTHTLKSAGRFARNSKKTIVVQKMNSSAVFRTAFWRKGRTSSNIIAHMTARKHCTALKICGKIPLIFHCLLRDSGHRLLCWFRLESTAKLVEVGKRRPFATELRPILYMKKMQKTVRRRSQKVSQGAPRIRRWISSICPSYR